MKQIIKPLPLHFSLRRTMNRQVTMAYSLIKNQLPGRCWSSRAPQGFTLPATEGPVTGGGRAGAARPPQLLNNNNKAADDRHEGPALFLRPLPSPHYRKDQRRSAGFFGGSVAPVRHALNQNQGGGGGEGKERGGGRRLHHDVIDVMMN